MNSLTISEQQTARQWLTSREPAAVDASLTTSLQSLGVGLRLVSEGRFPDTGGMYRVVVGSIVSLAPGSDLDAALVKIEAANTPPDRSDAEGWVAALHVATAGAKRSGEMGEMTVELYAAALMQWPADVAKAACKALATTPKAETAWFPTLPELMAVCERLGSPRRAMLHGIRAELTKGAVDHDAVAQADRRREWKLLAIQAEDEAFMCRRADPDLSSERMEFAAHARRMAA